MRRLLHPRVAHNPSGGVRAISRRPARSEGAGKLRRRARAIPLVVLLLAASACKRFERKHIPVESLPALGAPTCASLPRAPDAAPIAGALRSGPTHKEKDITERYAVAHEGCVVFRGRQDWALGGTDLEIVYDGDFTPLTVWKRMRIPALKDSASRAEIRRYELRTEPVGIERKAPDGHLSYEQLKGGRPRAVIAPGRGSITMWLQRARLAPGERVRELVLDARALEKIEPVTLMREPDMDHKDLGRVRVYTFYGRETVFADEHDRVIGDLAGMRPDARPAPTASEVFTHPDRHPK